MGRFAGDVRAASQSAFGGAAHGNQHILKLQCPTRNRSSCSSGGRNCSKNFATPTADGERERKPRRSRLRSEQLAGVRGASATLWGGTRNSTWRTTPTAPFVVFAYHNVFEALEELLRQESVSFGVVNGDTPDADRTRVTR